MTINKIYDIKNNQVVIDLPNSFKGKKKVKISISEVKQSKKDKIELMKKAFKDEKFLKDLKDVNDDFANIDNENWK
ncbi:MAG: hypothetical protein R2739_10070 [Chitinophagales bacterium]|nr:hypothetical protein [Bacteroidota bacterium]